MMYNHARMLADGWSCDIPYDVGYYWISHIGPIYVTSVVYVQCDEDKHNILTDTGMCIPVSKLDGAYWKALPYPSVHYKGNVTAEMAF